jgi:thiamine-phosphate pyrophosphorylase
VTTESFSLYLVTDRQRTAGRPLLDVVEAALRGGVDAVQLREKDLSGAALCTLAGRLRELTHRHGARLLINDRIDIALAVGADGVHLPVDSVAPADARRLLGRGPLIGASTHSVEQARAAAGGGADFIVCGPIFDTPSKRAFGTPLGLDGLTQIVRTVSLPTFAIGGLTADRTPLVRRCGAAGIAVVAAILEADDPYTAATALRQALA